METARSTAGTSLACAIVERRAPRRRTPRSRMAFPKDRRSRDGARAALVPASIALVLIVGAVEVALRARKSEPTALPEPAVRDPFADLPPEAPPEPREAPPRAPKLASKLPAVPEDVAQDPQWLGAKLLAAEASALYDLALSEIGRASCRER